MKTEKKIIESSEDVDKSQRNVALKIEEENKIHFFYQTIWNSKTQEIIMQNKGQTQNIKHI